MAYDVPGRADDVGDDLRARWNEQIRIRYESLGLPPTRYIELDPAELDDVRVTDTVKWAGDPLEPTFCVDDETLTQLCDSGPKGRHALHDEYCEYAVVRRVDSSGRMRPKRVQLTTELREYWVMLATHDPERLRSVAAEVLGVEPSWDDLYGTADPHALTEKERRESFATAMAGHGREKDLEDAGVPRDPVGPLNNENAVFMTHPINGLDDLIFIVAYGARRYAVRAATGGLRRAGKDDIFDRNNLQVLACRHADPAAALGAYAQVVNERAVAFADPLGMYIRPFTRELLEVDGQRVPDAWVRWSRGEEGMFQRLEFGPGDDDDAFLDDIRIFSGQESQPLTGGYQLLEALEVGPLLVTGAMPHGGDDDLEILEPGRAIDCRTVGACDTVNALLTEADR